RYLASPSAGGFGAHIASITTVSTPHRGTRIATWLVDHIDRGDEAIVNGFLSHFGAPAIGDTSHRANLLATLDALTVDGGQRLDDRLDDDPGVTYFSWAGVS